MSNAAMSCAWDAPDRPTASGALFVLIVLADHASDHSGEDWTAWPSVERIQARTELSRATVERHLASLVELGWISRKRRVRPDGKLGIYDYTVHRREEVRAGLRIERAQGLFEGDESGSRDAEPCRNLQHGPCVILSEAMPQIEASPCLNLQHQEPLEEPSTEPTQEAREPGDQGFEEGFAAWPLVGQARTDHPKARAAWALVCGEIGAAELGRRIARYLAEDRDLKAGRHGAPGLHTWLSGERWRAWSSPDPARPTLAALGGESVSGFAGPAALRAEIRAAQDEAFCVSYLDRGRWLDEGGLVPATRYAFDQLARSVGNIFRRHGVELVEPGVHVLGGKL